MKKITIHKYLIILFTISFLNCSKDGDIAENKVVYIPDVKFKELLMARTPKIDTNKDGEIQISEAEKITGLLNIYHNNINDLTGLNAFKNIDSLFIVSNNYNILNLKELSKLSHFLIGNSPDAINIVNNTSLTIIDLQKNLELKEIVISGCPNVTKLSLPSTSTKIKRMDINDMNKLKDMNLSSLKLLEFVSITQSNSLENIVFPTSVKGIRIYNTKIKELELSKTENLRHLRIQKNSNLTHANIKNTRNKLLEQVFFEDCINLKSICVDDIQYSNNNSFWKKDSTTQYSTNCN